MSRNLDSVMLAPISLSHAYRSWALSRWFLRSFRKFHVVKLSLKKCDHHLWFFDHFSNQSIPLFCSLFLCSINTRDPETETIITVLTCPSLPRYFSSLSSALSTWASSSSVKIWPLVNIGGPGVYPQYTLYVFRGFWT